MILGRRRRGHATILRASPTEDPTLAMSSVLEGSGGYEGLTLVLADTAPDNGGWGWIVARLGAADPGAASRVSIVTASVADSRHTRPSPFPS